MELGPNVHRRAGRFFEHQTGNQARGNANGAGQRHQGARAPQRAAARRGQHFFNHIRVGGSPLRDALINKGNHGVGEGGAIRRGRGDPPAYRYHRFVRHRQAELGFEIPG